jgi:alpha-methylacyl-CoA racemase
MSGPLSGLKIVEFAGLGPGPFCGMMLADHGAEVIRIDRLGPRFGISDAEREVMNRSRRSVAVDLKALEGKALVLELCKHADAVFEGFRPGVMERLGLGPDILMAANPKLVYGRMTGWGQDGPYAAMAGHDINYIALSGALHGIGRAGERPVPPLNLVGDFGGGGMMLAFGLLAAILHAKQTGQGQIVDCAMTEGSAVLMAMMYSLYAQERWTDRRGANIIDSGAHFYDAYETKDGKHVALGAVEPQFYRELLERIGLAGDAAFEVQNDPRLWPAQKAKLDAHFRTKTQVEWMAILEKTDSCFAPVLSLDDAPRHPHNVARQAFVMVDGVVQPSPAPRYSHTVNAAPAPMQSGADVTRQILLERGYSDDEIARLRERNIVA